jgi:EAL and modified HD-GYP domain-containing signal transduction protein
MQDQADSLFFTGLFSLLDVLVGRPMGELLAEIALDAAVKQALSGEENLLRPVYDLVLAHERADWARVTAAAAALGLAETALAETYWQAIEWASQAA